MPACNSQIIIDDPFIFKFYFLFGRMHVDINFIRIDFHKHDEERIEIFGKDIFVCGFNGMLKIWAANKSSIDKQELLSSRFFTKLWLAYISGEVYIVCFFLNRNEILVYFFSEDAQYSVAQRRCRQVV